MTYSSDLWEREEAYKERGKSGLPGSDKSLRSEKRVTYGREKKDTKREHKSLTVSDLP